MALPPGSKTRHPLPDTRLQWFPFWRLKVLDAQINWYSSVIESCRKGESLVSTFVATLQRTITITGLGVHDAPRAPFTLTGRRTCQGRL